MKKMYWNLDKLQFLTVLLVGMWISAGVVSSGFAQMTVVGGTTVKVNNATTLNSSENLMMNSGGTLNVQGTLILKKNLVNQNASPNSLGSGAIVLSGTTNQTVSGQNVIQDLTVNNAAGVTIAGNTQINGALTLTNGLVSLGSYNLQLGTLATVAGTPSANNMVVATGSGQMRKEYAGSGTFTFPVGDATGTADYSPVTVEYTSGNFASGNYTGVNLVDGQYPGTGESYLTRYWNVSNSGVTNFSSNATLKYVPADVVGNEEDIFFTKVLPLPFVTYNQANTGAHTIDAHGLSSFSTFTGNLGNGTTPPGIRSLQDKNISGTSCADATQTLIIAGNGTYYNVLNGALVTHIAGQNIIYYPGTKVVSGGYMHGYISNTYCNPPNPITSPVVAGNINEGAKALVQPDETIFKVYPNPTPGNFTLELKGDLPANDLHVEILGILGERIYTNDVKADRKQEFTLTGRPTGVYVVHVTSGNQTHTEKIIKK